MSVVIDDAALELLAGQLINCCVTQGKRVTTAESCTGGWITKCITDLPGSSAVLDGGFVTYSNTAKQQNLGVNSITLSEFGAVSELVAAEMAAGALQRSNADIAVAVTGIAGPGGGTAEKPVGTVCFGFAVGDSFDTETLCFNGDRDAVRRATVRHALSGLLARLSGE